MLEDLINLVKEHAGNAIVNNPAVPDQHNDAAIAATAGSIMDTLKQHASGGGLESIMQMFQGGGSAAGSSGISSMIQSGVVSTLASKFGIDQSAAGGIAQSLIPNVMNSLVNKTNDPNNSTFNLQSVMGALGGGGASGIMGTISNLFK